MNIDTNKAIALGYKLALGSGAVLILLYQAGYSFAYESYFLGSLFVLGLLQILILLVLGLPSFLAITNATRLQKDHFLLYLTFIESVRGLDIHDRAEVLHGLLSPLSHTEIVDLWSVARQHKPIDLHYLHEVLTSHLSTKA